MENGKWNYAGFLRNPSPFGVTSYKQNKKSAIKNKFSSHFFRFACDPCRIQTCNPHIRSVVLYSVELMDLSPQKVLRLFRVP